MPRSLASGSSPLSRGILHLPFQLKRFVRIIPALAGNTPIREPVQRPAQDHPRSRGEYLRVASVDVTRYGSSPLSRGIRPGELDIVVFTGIIPALAGNTPFRQ